MRKEISWVLLFIFFVNIASAHDIVNDVDFNLGNGVSVTVLSPMNFTQIVIDSTANNLRFNINQSIFYITPTNIVKLKITKFSITDNAYNFSLTGSGSVTITQNLTNANTKYNFFRNSVYSFDTTTNSTGWYTKNIVLTSGEHIFTYPETYVAPPVDPPTGGGGGGGGGGDEPIPTPSPTTNPPDSPPIINASEIIDVIGGGGGYIDEKVKEKVEEIKKTIGLNLDSIRKDPFGFMLLQASVFFFAFLALYSSRKESRMTLGSLVFFILMTVFLAYETWWVV